MAFTTVVNDINTAEKINKRQAAASAVIFGILGVVMGFAFGDLTGIGIAATFLFGIVGAVVGGASSYLLGKLNNWVKFGDAKEINLPTMENSQEQQHTHSKEKSPETEMTNEAKTILKDTPVNTSQKTQKADKGQSV